MPSTTVRVSESIRENLRALSEQTGESMQTVIEKALGEYRKRLFFEEVNAAYSTMRQDPTAWAEETAERQLFEGALADDLERDDE